ncbi:hypothetical protein BGX31_011505 [Mortierella sp. GBA43]|nr:hypothetical protein BGX31_011505 [Mortierella sp. GBA43]
MAFARAGQYFYFQGGFYQVTATLPLVTPQLVALPLNESWSTSSPPWKQLAIGNAYADHIAVATADTFITFVLQTPSLNLGRYNIQTNTWSYSVSTPPEALNSGFRPVVDPTSNIIYIAGSSKMNIYNPQKDQWTSQPLPSNVLTQRIFGGAVYNTLRKSILYFGGYSSTFEAQTYITEYTIGTGSWSIYNTTGDIPPPIADFCMATSDDGNTIAIFGGRFFTIDRFKVPDVFSGLLYVLDVQQKTWSKLVNVSPRAYTGCQIVNNQFIAWGGKDDKDAVLAAKEPLIFDLGKRLWVDTYTPPSTPSPKSNTNLGAILGGVFGCLVVVGASVVVYLYMFRNKRPLESGLPQHHQHHHHQQQKDHTNDADLRMEEVMSSTPSGNIVYQDHIKMSPERRPQGPQGIPEYIHGPRDRLPGPQGLPEPK